MARDVRLGIEVMDPARGRCWMRARELDAILYHHALDVASSDWLEYAQSDEFRRALRNAFDELAVNAPTSDDVIARCLDSGDCQQIRTLDAALRMCRSLGRLGTRVRGHDAAALIDRALQNPEFVPQQYFQVTPTDTSADTSGVELQLRGVVVLKVTGVRAPAASTEPVIRKTLGGFRVEVAPRLWAMLHDMGYRHLAAQLGLIATAMGALTLIEALVFRYLIGFQAPTELRTYTLVLLAVVLPSAAALACSVGQTRFSQALGRHLETRLRTDLLRKLPRIRDDYFASRLVSDLAERGHAITQLRDAPLIATTLLVDFVRIVMLLFGLAWIMSSLVWAVLLAGLVAIAAPLAMFRVLAERDLRARTHLGALSNLYLDALRGTEPIWTHGAARSLELEHEALLLRWVRASTQLRRVATVFESVQVFVLAGCGIALVLRAIDEVIPQGTVLLVAYWALFVPMLSRGLLVNLKQLPAMHNIVRRVLEILDAPEEATDAQPSARTGGVRLDLRQVSVVRGSQPVLAELDLTIDAGERVAIVGESGSGKSSFLGALSGWHTISDGRILIDGDEADAAQIQALRQHSALVDPETYLWNRELYANVLYGVGADATPAIDSVLDASELVFDLEKMADGLATRIGENGSRLSGGESQRLRIARALVRGNARLVLLDEPFSGMDADQRERMRRHAIDRWPEATLLWVSHHVRETLTFPRVLVFEHGRIVEDGAPQSLLRQPSRYAAMIAAEDALNARLHGAPWRVVEFDHTAPVTP